MEALTTALIAAAVGIIGAVAAWVVAFFKKKTTEEEIEALKVKQSALEDEVASVRKLATVHKLYVECPNCHTEIDLSEVEIYSKDNEEVKHD